MAQGKFCSPSPTSIALNMLTFQCSPVESQLLQHDHSEIFLLHFRHHSVIMPTLCPSFCPVGRILAAQVIWKAASVLIVGTLPWRHKWLWFTLRVSLRISFLQLRTLKWSLKERKSRTSVITTFIHFYLTSKILHVCKNIIKNFYTVQAILVYKFE